MPDSNVYKHVERHCIKYTYFLELFFLPFHVNYLLVHSSFLIASEHLLFKPSDLYLFDSAHSLFWHSLVPIFFFISCSDFCAWALGAVYLLMDFIFLSLLLNTFYTCSFDHLWYHSSQASILTGPHICRWSYLVLILFFPAF